MVVIIDVNNVVRVLLVVVGVIAVAFAGELNQVTRGTNSREAEQNEVVGTTLNVRVGEGAGLTFRSLAHPAAVLVHVVDSCGFARQPQRKDAQETHTPRGALCATHHECHVIAIYGNRLGQMTVTIEIRSLLAAGHNAQGSGGYSECNVLHNCIV